VAEQCEQGNKEGFQLFLRQGSVNVAGDGAALRKGRRGTYKQNGVNGCDGHAEGNGDTDVKEKEKE
jgi:hypothetical protein